MRKNLMTILLAAALVFPCFVHAGPIDGSSPCLCAITKVIECDALGECAEVSPEDANIPTFIKVDFNARILSGVDSVDSRTTPIKNFEQGDGVLMFQGAENQKGWSTIVNPKTGKLSGAVSGEGYGFLLFGTCTVLP
ncbi:hypothetical protein [Desulfosarcina sp.]|uniref:hypothetical protein n=1 Tax=Desulfosarcina sp. TaxID=2027861 RepID=UPI0029AC909B|nr:hypothetical protein [Desulfosarcina sp.]MDX2492974.1 hypothetical protein [Desulfosarcina sp.]